MNLTKRMLAAQIDYKAYAKKSDAAGRIVLYIINQ